MVVMKNGHFYAFDVITTDGRVLWAESPAMIMYTLFSIYSSLLRWKMILLPILTTSRIQPFLFKRLGELFELGRERVYNH